MKRRKRRGARPFPLLTVIAMALIVPVAVNYIYHNGELVGQAGRQAAIFSAAVNMPDSSFDLLRDRFRSELYGEQSDQSSSGADAPSRSEREPEGPDRRQDMPEESGGAAAQPETAPAPPKIPKEYAAMLLSENFGGTENGTLLRFGAGYIKNDTKHSDEDVLSFFDKPFELRFEAADVPQVLIYHTHATESFEKYDNTVYDTRNTWRSNNNLENMVAVGDAMAEVLRQSGIGVIHDTTQHDYPSYNGSYERSAKTVSQYLEEYPSIKVVLDLHRDAMERENGTIVKPVAMVGGRKAAQVMIISGCDDGTMNMPDWKSNFRFAIAFQDYMESAFPGLTRPVFFSHRKYNQNLSTGALLLEFGSNANTLEEAVYSAELAGQALAELIRDHIE